MPISELLLAWPDQLVVAQAQVPNGSEQAIAIQLRLNQYSQAQAQLLRALACQPESLPHLFLLGVLRLQQGQGGPVVALQ